MSRENEERMFRVLLALASACSAFAAFYVRSMAEDQRELTKTVTDLCIKVAKLDERLNSALKHDNTNYYGASLQTVFASNDPSKQSNGVNNEDSKRQ
jgi:hypothetical protein